MISENQKTRYYDVNPGVQQQLSGTATHVLLTYC